MSLIARPVLTSAEQDTLRKAMSDPAFVELIEKVCVREILDGQDKIGAILRTGDREKTKDAYVYAGQVGVWENLVRILRKG